MAKLYLRRIGNDLCPDRHDCPAIHEETRRGTAVVIGDKMPADELAQLAIGPGETAVQIPLAVLEEAIRAYHHR